MSDVNEFLHWLEENDMVVCVEKDGQYVPVPETGVLYDDLIIDFRASYMGPEEEDVAE